jgi:hypothetical protein
MRAAVLIVLAFTLAGCGQTWTEAEVDLLQQSRAALHAGEYDDAAKSLTVLAEGHTSAPVPEYDAEAAEASRTRVRDEREAQSNARGALIAVGIGLLTLLVGRKPAQAIGGLIKRKLATGKGGSTYGEAVVGDGGSGGRRGSRRQPRGPGSPVHAERVGLDDSPGATGATEESSSA